MKKLILKTVLLVLLSPLAFAQNAKKSNSIPLINPANNCQTRYWYYPNLEAYFDTQKRVFYYMQNEVWQTSEEIPAGYRGYSFYNNISVVIKDYDGDEIFQFINKHKKKYPYINNERSLKLITQTD